MVYAGTTGVHVAMLIHSREDAALAAGFKDRTMDNYVTMVPVLKVLKGTGSIWLKGT